MLRGEGAEQVDLDKPGFFPVGVEIVHHQLGRAGDAAHGDDHVRGVRRAVVVEQLVAPPGDVADAVEIALHHGGQALIKTVVGFADLEIDVGVLHRVAQHGVFWVQRPGAEGLQGLPVQQGAQGLPVDHLHGAQLMAGAEAVKEMQERDPRLDGGQVGHGGQIDHLHRGIRRCLDEKGPRVLLDRALDCGGIGEVDIVELESEVGENVGEQAVGAAVEVVAHEEVVAGLEEFQQR